MFLHLILNTGTIFLKQLVLFRLHYWSKRNPDNNSLEEEKWMCTA